MDIIVLHPLQALVEFLIEIFQVTQVTESGGNKKKTQKFR